jgi:hypothetical protein
MQLNNEEMTLIHAALNTHLDKPLNPTIKAAIKTLKRRIEMAMLGMEV